jgi:hypothetical protein
MESRSQAIRKIATLNRKLNPVAKGYTYRVFFNEADGKFYKKVRHDKKALRLFNELEKKIIISNILIERSDGEQLIFAIKNSYRFKKINDVPYITINTTVAELFDNEK